MTPRLLDDRYELLELRVAGPVTNVYSGVDHELRRRVSVEVLNEGFSGDQSSVLLFDQAIEAAAALDHPNIIRTRGPMVSGGVHYAVRDTHDGRPLDELLADTGSLPPAVAVTVAIAIGEALAHAHEHGLPHGALTPADILVTRTTARLSGFGLAARTVYGLDGRYAAPERADQAEGDPRSDLYALGCCLFEMLAGHPPDPTAGRISLGGDRQAAATLPAGLVSAVDRLAAARPSDRYGQASEAVADLRRFQMEERARGTWAAGRPELAETVVLPQIDGSGTGGVAAAPAAKHVRPRQPGRRTTAVLMAVALPVVGAVVLGLRWADQAATSAGEDPPPATDEVAAPVAPPVRAGQTGDPQVSGTVKPPAEAATTTTTTTTLPPTTTTTSPPTTVAPTTEPPATSEPSTTTTSPSRTVPQVVEREEDDAVRILQEAGFEVDVDHDRAWWHWWEGRVMHQDPWGGQEAPEGSTVEITVGRDGR